MPTGTYLDNPATSADALLGGNYTGPTIGPAPQIGGVITQGLAPSARGQGWFAEAIKNIFANAPGAQTQAPQMYNALGQPISGYEMKNIYNGKEEISLNPIAYDQSGNRFTYDANKKQYVRDATGIFTQGSQAPTRAQANPWVGSDLSNPPPSLSWEHLHALYPGKSFKELQGLMSQMGYSWNPNTSGKGNKEFAGSFLPDSMNPNQTQNGAVMGPPGARGRPEWVDPTTLARGERVQTESGTTYVGGTPTAGGQSQYAITVSQNLNKKMEANGDYRWNSKVVKDENGNWARIYWKELRPVGQGKKQQGDNGVARAETPAFSGTTKHQLVTLRANYG
jgi:hypothetical protein